MTEPPKAYSEATMMGDDTLVPEEPCPYYIKTTIDGQLEDLYCEVGPAGHEGPHIGMCSYTEHLAKRRAWKEAKNQEKDKQDERTTPRIVGELLEP